ncbi:MAG: ABC transporter ATP-binding protein [Aureispira sp.]
MITVNNLSYTYPKASKPILKQLNFEIAQGEIFGFLGPSGAGKSTTQKILYKILTNYTGEVLIDGQSLLNLGQAYYTRVGVGFELPNHYLKLTGRENLQLFAGFYPTENIQDMVALFEAVGMVDAIDKRVEEYSKGMKMRLNFIRSILHSPDIIFFDEPTSGLDPINAHRIKELIKELRAQGKTIFITTHDMTTADELCDRVSFIVNGEIILTEEPTVLKHANGKKCVRVQNKALGFQEFGLENLAQNAPFLEAIGRADLMKIETLEATLEEVFIKVTGQSLSH